jgi:perosamine synthetase
LIRISPVHVDEQAVAAVVSVLRSGQLAQGDEVVSFEREFATLCGTRHALAVSSGTAALTAALIGAGVGAGDEVITAAFSFAAVVNASLAIGAIVRFADVSIDDFAIDPASIDELVTARTKAIVPVHLFGQSADMTDILRIAREHDLRVIEDAAQSHGAEYEGRRVGGLGHAGCFSFYATKNITTGEGGMVTTDDDALAGEVRALRNQGMRERYQHVRPGFNWRLTDIQAALGRAQLPRYDDLVERRRRHAAALTEGLAELPGLVTPREMRGRCHVWHLYTVRITSDARLTRDALQRALAHDGIESAVHYPAALPDIAAFGRPGCTAPVNVPVSRRLANEVLAVPVHQSLTDADVRRVVDRIRAHLM